MEEYKASNERAAQARLAEKQNAQNGRSPKRPGGYNGQIRTSKKTFKKR